MPQTCTRRRTLLDITPPADGDLYVTAQVDALDGYTFPILHLPRDAWDDLGSPPTVTVTLEPGDRLNQY